MFDALKARGFEVLTLHHAEAILRHDMAAAETELEKVLLNMSIPVSELVASGGGEAKATQRLRGALSDQGWVKHNFVISKTVDGVTKESTSHEVDHVRRFGDWTFALEIEWNNKDPFFDRDLENFKRLHSEGAISVGAIITRGSSLQGKLVSLIEHFAIAQGIKCVDDIRERQLYTPTPRQIERYNKGLMSGSSFALAWAKAFVADKFGEATTHWRKLRDRVDRGVGNPCPLLLIGLPDSVIRE